MMQNQIATEQNYSLNDCRNGYRLRLASTKLKSGRYQVKFYASIPQKKEFYGYVLVNPNDTLKHVVGEITDRLKVIRLTSEFRHINLFSLRKTAPISSNVLIFESQKT